jgi:hypothetical protein
MKKDKHLGKLEFLAEILGLGKNVQTVWCKLCYEIMTKLTTCRLILGASKKGVKSKYLQKGSRNRFKP